MIATLLKRYWGYETFRPLQEDIINSVLAGKDTFALLPTGGGKSVCYQLPAIAMDGFCLVITPLISLMQDQLSRLKALEIPAACLHGGMHYKEVEQTLKNMLHGPYKLLYVSPERLQSSLFQEFLPELNISFIAVDEAHCVSQWGHDFRPDYLKISALRTHLADQPMLVLTASATAVVQQDIITHLQLERPNIFTYSFKRANLFCEVHYTENKNKDIIPYLPKDGAGIIYCRSRKQCEFLSNYLRQEGYSAGAYHAGLDKKTRTAVYEAWMQDELRLVVATTAFGMGIDKPNVRAVIHFELPEDLESYYQESGRAGRDGKSAQAICLYNQRDEERLAHSLAIQFPAEQYLRQVYQSVAEYLQIEIGNEPDRYYDFDLQDFCKKFKLEQLPATYALKLLEQEGLWTMTESIVHPATLLFICSRHEIDHLEQRYPALHYICTGILRMYGTIFSYTTTVRLAFIAKQLKMKTEDLLTALHYLEGMQILKYTAANEGPQLYVHHYRVDSRYLLLDMGRIEKLKQAKQNRLRALLSFVHNTSICREQQLLQYFGEQSSTPCGHCDVCYSQDMLLNFNTEKAQEIIMAYMKANPQGHVATLLQLFAMVHKEQLIALLREMEDNKLLSIDEKHQYQSKIA